jgi:hypothetical protein
VIRRPQSGIEEVEQRKGDSREWNLGRFRDIMMSGGNMIASDKQIGVEKLVEMMNNQSLSSTRFPLRPLSQRSVWFENQSTLQPHYFTGGHLT